MRSILFCRTLLGPLHSVELEASEPAVEQLQVPLTGPFRSGLILHTTPPETQRQIKFSLSGCTQTNVLVQKDPVYRRFYENKNLVKIKSLLVSTSHRDFLFSLVTKTTCLEKRFSFGVTITTFSEPDPTRPDALRCSIVTSPDFLLCSRWLRGFTCGSSGFTSWWTLSNDILQHHYKY